MYEQKIIENLREFSAKYQYEDQKLSETCFRAADAIEEMVRKEKFHAFLWNTIQPNEMEQYLAMYRAQAVPSEPPKEET